MVGKRCRSSRHRLPVVLLLVLLFGVVMIQYACPTDSKCHARLQVGSWFPLGGFASGSGGGEGSGRSPKDPYVAEDGALARFVPRYNFSQEDLSRVVDFNINGDDVIVFLHIQKTGGTTFGRHLVRNMHLERPCECHAGQKRCTCFRPGKTETWLFSRLSTGWSCGLHADWTELISCVPSRMDSQEAPSNLPRNYFYITILRDPVLRYLSEWRHVQRGATWRASLHVCDGRSPTLSELPSCYSGDDWSGCSLKEFMDCPYNLANNRQTRMLADLSLVGCYNVSTMSEEDRWAVILESAKRNLRSMAFFGLTEYQRKTQYLFERTFNLEFIDPFTQLNGTHASSVDVLLDIQHKIRQLNQYDMEFYEYARDLFLQRYQVARQLKHRQARERRQQERRRLRGKLAVKQGGQQKSVEVPHTTSSRSAASDVQQGENGAEDTDLADWWLGEDDPREDYMDNVEQW